MIATGRAPHQPESHLDTPRPIARRGAVAQRPALSSEASGLLGHDCEGVSEGDPDRLATGLASLHESIKGAPDTDTVGSVSSRSMRFGPYDLAIVALNTALVRVFFPAGTLGGADGRETASGAC